MTFDDALHTLMAACRPSQAHMTVLNRQADLWADRLATHLSGHATVLRPMAFGSTSRGTATQPVNDCDRVLFLDIPIQGDRPVLSARRLLTELGCTAATGLMALRSAGHDVPFRARVQGHSVGLRHTAGAAHIDLVPMVPAPGVRLRKRPDIALLPERDTDRWIEVRPLEQRERLHEAAERAPDLLGAIALLKAWKRGRELALPSIVVEHLLMGLRPSIADLPNLLFEGLGRLAALDTGGALPEVPLPLVNALARKDRQAVAVAAREVLGTLRGLAAQGREEARADRDLEEALCHALLGRPRTPLLKPSPPLWRESDPWMELDR